MKLHRFIGSVSLAQDTITINDAMLIHQLKDVLRLGVGDSFVLCDGDLREAIITISVLTSNCVEGIVSNRRIVSVAALRDTTLYCALLKRENFELVAQKCTECGIARIVPMYTKYTVKLNLKYERIQKIMHEAAEQSGRGRVPALERATRFNEAVLQHGNYESNIFFDISGNTFDVGIFRKIKKASIWIGPEGGWSAEELGAAKENNFSIMRFGDMMLRAETAAIVGSYAICNI